MKMVLIMKRHTRSNTHLGIRKKILGKLGLGFALGTTGILFFLFLFGFIVDKLLLLLQDIQLLLVAGFLGIDLQFGFIELFIE